VTTISQQRQPGTSGERGFTLVEVLVSTVVLTVGLVSLLGVFGMAMATTQTAQQDLIAKQLASEAMESIFTARQTTQLTWDDIHNVSLGGIFLDNPPFQPIYNTGGDGIVGTDDDAASGARTLTSPGPDGIVGTVAGKNDDITIPLTGYQRRIQISPVTDSNNNLIADLRTITITVQYDVPRTKIKKNYIMTGYISQYR
jgi:prepilin-type N-terminal cleavage/methylation domain-containing protein